MLFYSGFPSIKVPSWASFREEMDRDRYNADRVPTLDRSQELTELNLYWLKAIRMLQRNIVVLAYLLEK